MTKTHIFSVTEATRLLKNVIEAEDFFQNIWIKGEVSNLREYKMGNQLYFTLKDEKSQINCVVFGNSSFSLQDNMQIIARGKITVYEKRGTYNFQVSYMEPAGLGALALAFEQLKQKLYAEGLFREEYKKKIPLYPRLVGVITSPSGAVIHDIVTTIRQRNPATQIVIIPTIVQGKGAGKSIAGSIEFANKYKELEVLILARGGGSIEELWGFNEEIVARAIFKSEIPIISAVGHEVDYTIADFTADARVATPTAAGMLVSIPKDEYLQLIMSLRERLKSLLINCLQEKRMILADYNHELIQSVQRIYNGKKNAFVRLMAKLQALNPASIAEKGYVLVSKGGKVIKSAKELVTADKIELVFYDGTINATVS